jgi:hypothetical protein
VNGEQRDLMFDFPKWREWLKEKTNQIGQEGFKTEFKSGPDDIPKPGMALGIVGLNAMALFESWATGETDYTIEAPPSPTGKMVCHRWGLILDDDTFETTFHEFINEFRRFEASN